LPSNSKNHPENTPRIYLWARFLANLTAVILIGSFLSYNVAKTLATISLLHFATPTNINLKKSNEINYQLKLENENYYVYVPKNYNGKEPFGLIVYISPSDYFTQLPPGWSEILDARHFIFIAPQGAGNDSGQPRRYGLGILGALAAMNEYKIDPSRVYAAGLSGGARAAGHMAFFQSDLFKGTIQACGADFYKIVPHGNGPNWVDSNGQVNYGFVSFPPEDVHNAKAIVRFTIITGSKDFRHGNLTDIYNGGFRPEGFMCKFFDIPNMGHEDCSAETLNQAIDFLEGKEP